MTDTDKQTADQPVADDQNVDKPQSDKADPGPTVKSEPVQDAPAPDSGGDQAVGTDQHGRQLFEVDCSSCGNKAQVPFKPSGNRPVYCRDCYMKQRSDQGPRR